MASETQNLDLSICIVTWHTSDELKECLSSILAYSEGLKIEVLIFDKASTDNTIEIVKSEFPEVNFIANHKNIGFARANNQLIKKSRGKYILLLNPDIVLIEPSLRKMMNLLEMNPHIGLVGCTLVNPDGTIQESFWRSFPNLRSELILALGLHRIKRQTTQKNRLDSPIVEVAWIVGANMLFRRDVLFKLRGFSEQYFMYSEDVDLCYRLNKLGYRTYVLRNVTMFHYHAVSSKKQSRRSFGAVLEKESRLAFMNSHYGSITAISYRLIWLTCSIIRLVSIILVLVVSYPTLKQKKTYLIRLLEKHLNILSWALGLQKWTKRL